VNQSDPRNKKAAIDSTQQRRTFFVKFAAVVAGLAGLIAPAAAGLVVFLSPLRRRTRKAEFVRITNLSAVPADGAPVLFSVVKKRFDAWTSHAAEPVGAVYLRREPGGKVRAFNAVCPHLGCFVGVSEDRFACPCHDSSFEFSGARINPESCPSPRDLDPLAVDATRLAEEQEVWVAFRSFEAAIPERVDSVTGEKVEDVS
jgi:menaquinol-cytochrome c reductase iron-sulfur subunit